MKKEFLTKIYVPLLYIAGWYTSSQLNAIKASYTDQIEGNSSSSVATFVVLVTLSAILIWKANDAYNSSPSSSPNQDSKTET